MAFVLLNKNRNNKRKEDEVEEKGKQNNLKDKAKRLKI